MAACWSSLKVEMMKWVGARKRFKDEKSELLVPELCKMWSKVYEIELKHQLEWSTNSDGAHAVKFGAFLTKLNAVVPGNIEVLLQ